jgi:hypothetical protein
LCISPGLWWTFETPWLTPGSCSSHLFSVMVKETDSGVRWPGFKPVLLFHSCVIWDTFLNLSESVSSPLKWGPKQDPGHDGVGCCLRSLSPWLPGCSQAGLGALPFLGTWT